MAGESVRCEVYNRGMWSQDLFLHALHFAASAHDGQRVPGSGHPYLVHAASYPLVGMASVGRLPSPVEGHRLVTALVRV